MSPAVIGLLAALHTGASVGDGGLARRDDLVRLLRMNDDGREDRTSGAHIWISRGADVALIGVVYPDKRSPILEQTGIGQGWIAPQQAWIRDPQSKALVERAVFVMVLRAPDLHTCLVNVLDGKRVLADKYGQVQVKSQVEMQCADLWSTPALSSFDAAQRAEIDAYLKLPEGVPPT